MAFQRVRREKGIREIRPGVYEVQVHVGRDPITGRVRQVSRTTSQGIADARRLRARLLVEVAQGRHGRTPPSLGAALAAWLDHLDRSGRSPTTLAEYRRKVDRVIGPALGDRRLDALSAGDLDTFYARQLQAGNAARSVLHYHRIIGAALHQAERWGWIDRNVARQATPPTSGPVTPAIPSPERVRALIAISSASRAPQMAAVITVAASTGLRRGELCALRWCDVDWDGRLLAVRRSIWQAGGRWGVKGPGAHRERRLAMGDQTIRVLSERRARVVAAARAAGGVLSDDAYVFSPAVDGMRPMLPDTVTSGFARLCRRMEALASEADPPRDEPWPYRFHDLRHFSAAQLLGAGHAARTVADRLGPADGGAVAMRGPDAPERLDPPRGDDLPPPPSRVAAHSPG
ncbi:MAG TPA: site-specific integrase [Acidimicrobiales bacterium]